MKTIQHRLYIQIFEHGGEPRVSSLDCSNVGSRVVGTFDVDVPIPDYIDKDSAAWEQAERRRAKSILRVAQDEADAILKGLENE